MKNIELLSPAGDFECLKAAVQNGADSVYFGGSLFNARASAGNFDTDGLKKAIDYCTLRNVKTHLTLNTLIKNSEFDDAVALAKQAYEFGIDAIIVQDLGLAKFLIENFPDLPIHASTQMSIHNIEGVRSAESLGFKRAVLARELSANEIEYICRNSNIEIEAFIHGALCICYSGQCLFSSAVGGRSGNRGKCAQPCRLPYELVSKSSNGDAISEKTLDKGYLLSPRDLCGLNFIPTLIDAGVKCFKIEGRMKTPEYVATVTRIYRKYIDMALSSDKYIVDKNDIHELMQVFNRGGFSSGHLDDKPNRDLIFKDKSNNMGLYLGNISNYNKNKGHVTLTLSEPLSVGDTISFEKESSKYAVSELMIGNKNLSDCETGKKVTIGRMKGNISIGDKVYKLSCKELCSSAENSYKTVENKKLPINCEVFIKKEQPISMRVFTKNMSKNDIYDNININVTSDTIPVDALKTPIDSERVINQISKTGNTPYQFKNIKVYLDKGLYIPSISSLNELRRIALDKLQDEILSRKRRNFQHISENCISDSSNHSNMPSECPNISILLRNLYPEYDYTLLNKEKISKIYLSLKLFINKNYRDIITYLSQNYDVYIYMPTIVKANYRNLILNNIDTILQEFRIKGFVISNISDFTLLKKYSKNYDFIGNYSLNVFNKFTMKEYSNLGLSTVTVSRELSKSTLNELLRSSQVNTELIVYGNLPLMATNYCFLGKTNKCYPMCGLNCKKDVSYYLKDRLGFYFQVVPDDIQTVSLIFNSKTLSISTTDIPINSVRIDILNETIDEINQVIHHTYQRNRVEGKDYTNGNLNKEV